MKIFRQAIIILAIYFISEILAKALALPVPGNILGMIILFLLLVSGVIKLEKVESLANFFLDHLAFFFIPAGIGLMNSFEQISSSSVEIVLICIITTVIVMVSTGLTVQFVSRIMSNKNRKIRKEEE